jgi:hypothetical protein
MVRCALVRNGFLRGIRPAVEMESADLHGFAGRYETKVTI